MLSIKRQVIIVLVITVLIVQFGSIAQEVGTIITNTGWYDDFENYSFGTFPDTYWSSSGNTDIYVDSGEAAFGTKSVRLYGVVGGCWGALLHRQFEVDSSYSIEFYTRIGNEELSGCHPKRAVISFNTGPSWETENRLLISFDGDGKIRGSVHTTDGYEGTVIGNYSIETWINVKLHYERLENDSIKMMYWINDTLKLSEILPSFPFESEFNYLSPQSGEGTAWFDDISVNSISTNVGIDNPLLPTSFLLEQNYPNPFNPTTVISYSLHVNSWVNLKVYNTLGQEMAVLVDDMQDAGYKSVAFNAGGLPSGVYMYRITAGTYTSVKKMIIIQ